MWVEDGGFVWPKRDFGPPTRCKRICVKGFFTACQSKNHANVQKMRIFSNTGEAQKCPQHQSFAGSNARKKCICCVVFFFKERNRWGQ